MTTPPSETSPIIVLNADDFGLSPGISRVIEDLFHRGLISGTSAMTLSPHWRSCGPLIRQFASVADIGLHFTLTELPPLSGLGFASGNRNVATFWDIFRSSCTGRIDRQAVKSEFIRQWQAFVDVMGDPPSHIDGHQHIHQLPGIRETILETLAELAPDGSVYLRICDERLMTIAARRLGTFRALALAGFGRGLRRRAKASNIGVNSSLSGIYDFDHQQPYEITFQNFLIGLRAEAIILCHPGQSDECYADDPISEARSSEYRALSSGKISDLLERHNFSIGRLADAKPL